MQAHNFPAQITTGVLFLFAQTIMTGEDYPRRLTKNVLSRGSLHKTML